MKPGLALLLLAVMAGVAVPAAAQVDGFSLVNNSGGALSGVAVRRVGSAEWLPLGIAPPAGANMRASFSNTDCAFDLRAIVAGAGEIMWRGLNLCDVKSVTLNRDRAGRAWVDYD